MSIRIACTVATDLFRAHDDERIRAALHQASAKDAQTLLASAQEQLAAAEALQARKFRLKYRRVKQA